MLGSRQDRIDALYKVINVVRNTPGGYGWEIDILRDVVNEEESKLEREEEE